MVECPICNITTKVCEKLGDRAFCEKLLKELGTDKITPKEFIDKLTNRFGEKNFLEEMKKETKNAKSLV